MCIKIVLLDKIQSLLSIRPRPFLHLLHCRRIRAIFLHLHGQLSTFTVIFSPPWLPTLCCTTKELILASRDSIYLFLFAMVRALNYLIVTSSASQPCTFRCSFDTTLLRLDTIRSLWFWMPASSAARRCISSCCLFPAPAHHSLTCPHRKLFRLQPLAV